MTPPETLHDLTSRRRLPVETLANPLMDLCLALWSALGGDDKAAAHELGKDWYRSFAASLSDDVVDRMTRFGLDTGYLWVLVASVLAADAPSTSEADELLHWLETADLSSLHAHLFDDRDADDELLEAAKEGDADAIAQICCDLDDAKRPSIEAFLAIPADRLGPEIASILRDIRNGSFAPFEMSWSRALTTSGRSVRTLAGTLEPEALIERVSNGIAYDIPFGTSKLVLVPSVGIRPWTLVSGAGGALVVFYPVADEHLDADPDAPPRWLVSLHKALGDERRLRMLRRISESEVGLAELTDLLGLAKSTVFHHIGVLRSAGLVRVRVTDDAAPTYTLRSDVLADARGMLDDYLRPSRRAAEEGSR
jgi:DNA-binding transcriptional ArsR family regulator